MDDKLSRWWDSLPEQRRAEARELAPGEDVPTWVVASLAAVGRSWITLAWFPSDGVESEPLPMPEELLRFIQAQD